MTESGIPYKKQKPKQPPDEVGIHPASPDIFEPHREMQPPTSQYPMAPIPAASHNFYVKYVAEPLILQRNSGHTQQQNMPKRRLKATNNN